MPDRHSSLAEKLNRLFEERRKPDGSPYTQTDIVEGTQGILTRVYLWKLHTGRATHLNSITLGAAMLDQEGKQVVLNLIDVFDQDQGQGLKRTNV